MLVQPDDVMNAVQDIRAVIARPMAHRPLPVKATQKDHEQRISIFN